MARSNQANDIFAETSFLYGGNADYIEELYAQYESDPSSVSQDWSDFFAGLKDDAAVVKKNADGPSWQRTNWPIAQNGELVSALDGDWGAVEQKIETKVKKEAQKQGVDLNEAALNQARQDSVRALMLIRAYRVRGHLHAKLDPLGFALENFDPVGRWRSTYENGREVDASGQLFRKHAFKNVVEFKDAILAEKHRFTRAFAEHTLSYALGRTLTPADTPAIDRITERVATDGYRLQTVLHEVVQSAPFVNRPQAKQPRQHR